MAGSKRKRENGTGSEAPNRKRKLDLEGVGSTGTASLSGIREALEGGDAGFEKEKGKKRGKQRGEAKRGDNLESRPLSDAEPHRKKNKEKEKEKEIMKVKEEEQKLEKEQEDSPLSSRLDGLQSVADHVPVSSAEPQRKRKKLKEVIHLPSSPVTSQIVEDHGLVIGAEPQRKKKKITEVLSAPVTLDSSQIVDYSQGKKKKVKEVIVVPGTLDSSQIAENERGKKKKKKTKEVVAVPVTLDLSRTAEDGQRKKKKETKKGVAPAPYTSDSPQIVQDGLGNGGESHGKEKKNKKRRVSTVLSSSDPSQAAEDCGPATGSAKNTILKSRRPQAGNGAESNRKNKKQVTFQLPDRVDDEPSESELPGNETDLLPELEFNTWATDMLRPGLVYGSYTAEEDGLLKQAIFDYIQEQGWDREEGLEKILKSRGSEARGCWHVIRKCLPQRELKRLYARAHRILGPGTLLGKWSTEEIQALTELHSVHGNDWKRISTIIGRDAEACKDKWRHLKWCNIKDRKTGAWSEEEQQKLYQLILKCLHVKTQMVKKNLTTNGHRLVRDDINWEFVAEQMGGRGRLDCLSQWYRKMASPMVTTGEWSNGDDQRLLARLMEEFPLSEELIEWDSLLNNRSGETCKKRWEQMQRTLGRGPEVRHQHFLEKLESIVKRYAPHLLDTEYEYDDKFAEDMQRADAAEQEDLDPGPDLLDV